MTTSVARTPKQVQQRGRNRRADRDGRDHDALEHAEDAAEQLARGGALQQRDPGDVDERVADADERQHDERQRQDLASAIRAIGMPHSISPTTKTWSGARAARARAPAPRPPARRPEGGDQRADAAVAGVQQLERRHHREHVERPRRAPARRRE